MSIGQFLDYTGDNEPQDDGPSDPPNNQPDPNDKSGSYGCLSCLGIIAIIAVIVWFFSR